MTQADTTFKMKLLSSIDFHRECVPISILNLHSIIVGPVVASCHCWVQLTECPNVHEELKDDDEGVQTDQEDDDQVEPMVVQDMLHAPTPTGGRREEAHEVRV